jgi:membrane-bound ClpP family serine protease
MTLGTALMFGVCILLLAGIIVTVSRHKKSGTHDVKLVGSSGTVDTKLDPHGTVLIRGELWPASCNSGTELPPGCLVKVVGTRDHLLIVKPQD